MKIYQEKTNLAELRDFYGILQKDMAIYLGVSRGQMSNMEYDRRSWPTDTVIKQILMEPINLPPMPAALQEQIDALYQQDKDNWAKEQKLAADKAKQMLQTLQTDMATLQQKAQQATNTLRLAAAILEKLTTEASTTTEKDRTLWAALQQKAWIQLRENGPAAQGKLQEKIDGLLVFVGKWG
ncbi:hypothetical protein [Parasediminibacterium sp. JCM 36343]|uniref:hypothetical protein n=1 Tax=Parasediminibacterium sp. JCM 36343 TaxID=3374279 RepID=UPI003979BA6A